MHERQRRESAPLRYTVPGTPGHAFVRELAPSGSEIVVRKYRSSAFWGTNLEMLLRSNGIKTVVVGGCTTEGCVESTARDAMFNDLYVVIAVDCVASDDRAQHEASMLLMRHRFDMATSADISTVWQAPRMPETATG
ncbi:MAG: isochorismatase family cysteine hydrolase [Candidatus Dormiibacterota bacterium]